MKKSIYFKMNMPEYSDPIDIEDLTDDLKTIDTALMTTRCSKSRTTNSINEKVILPYCRVANENEFDITVIDRNFNVEYVIEAGKGKKFEIDGVNYDMNFMVKDLHEAKFEWFIPVADAIAEGGGGSGGTSNYNDLTNKPQINSVTLSGNKTLADIGILNSEGKIKSDLLPEFVDNYDSYANRAAFPATGVEDRLYLAQDTRLSYVWDTATSDYVVVGSPLALGESESTAYRGDRGKTAYDHSQATHARTDATAVTASTTNGNIKINGTETTVYTHPKATGSSDTNPHGTTASDVGLDDALKYSEQVLSLEQKTQARANIGAGTSSFSGSYSDLSDIPSEFTPASHTHTTYENNISSLDSRVTNLEKRTSKIYGFHINSNESNPSNAVTYLADAVGMTPAYMDYTADKFNYGSWEGAFFMPRPCMLNADGTVAYYLDPNDYTKKVDGTDSDITDTTHSMNAMIEWGNEGRQIWVKKIADADDPYSCSVFISPYQVDEDYHAWSFIGTDGTLKEHFYTPIYNGSVVGTKLRSLSGLAPCQRKSAKEEIDLATANGSGWFTEVFCDVDLINDLLVLISKTLDTQTAFGTGNIKSGQGEADMLVSGQINKSDTEYLANKKGLFYGGNDQLTVVKVFGMENWFGNQWRRFAGMINDNGNIKIKKCFGTSDGSSVQTYGIPTNNTNAVANGYIATGITPSGTNGGRISKVDYSAGMTLPSVSSGSDTTYYCDGLWFNNGQVDYVLRGGGCDIGFRCGGFCLALNDVASYSHWSIGTALSFKGGN